MGSNSLEIDLQPFTETLNLLDWGRLCLHLSKFASTENGRAECMNFVLPININESKTRLGETLEIGELDLNLEGGISFKGIYNLGHTLTRCSKGGVVISENLLKVAQTLSAARRIRRQIIDLELRPYTTRLIKDVATLPDLEKLLLNGIEESGRISDRASSRLTELRLKLNAKHLERKDRLQEILRKHLSILQDKTIGDRDGRAVLSIKAGALDQIPGIVHGSSGSGQTVFVEPQLIIPLHNQIRTIEIAIAEEETRLLQAWSLEVGKYFAPLQHLEKVMVKLDFALARSRYGKWIQGVPALLEDKEDAPFVFHQLRHPLLVWKEVHEDGNKVIPINVEVGSQSRVVAITGPNTGGKTATLKSIGLAVLMARSGLLLPCIGNPSLPWCNQVLADIGDEQSLQQNLSTFSGHIKRIARIFRSIDETSGPSIVLLDEVGAGTDPVEGTALAISLLRSFAHKARLTIATTHFGELKSLKYSDNRFENASVGFDSKTLTPTYQLQWGIPGRSNALEISSRLGLNPQVIENAQKLIGSNQDVEEVIQGLEQQRNRQQKAAEASAELLARTEILHEELLDRWQKECMLSADFRERGRQELLLEIREGQKEVSNLISRLRQHGADGELARTTGKRLRQLANQNHSPTLKKQIYSDWSPKLGDQVRIIPLNKVGEVLDVSADGMLLTVLCGVFRSTVDLADVESVDGRKPVLDESTVQVKTKNTIKKNSSLIRTQNNTLDIRGMRVHEAESAVEEFLRFTSGAVWIVHGIGTGKLKRGLRLWLGTLPYVEKISDANQIDGGSGCTVVWLL